MTTSVLIFIVAITVKCKVTTHDAQTKPTTKCWSDKERLADSALAGSVPSVLRSCKTARKFSKKSFHHLHLSLFQN